MGPRLVSRGNGERDLRSANAVASMGPRLVSRGNTNRDRHIGEHCLASMGPRLVSRGNPSDVMRQRLNHGLQWGRGLLAAEISEAVEPARGARFNGAAAC